MVYDDTVVVVVIDKWYLLFSFQNTKEFVNDATPLAFKQLSSAKANRRTPPKMDKGDKLATDSPIAVHVEVLPTMESSVNSPVHQITPAASASKSSTKVENILGH